MGTGFTSSIGAAKEVNYLNDWSGSRARRNIAYAASRDLLGGRLGKVGRAVSGYGQILGTMLEESISRGFSYTMDWLADDKDEDRATKTKK